MILTLRRRHRRIMLTLALGLPAAFAVAILNRRPVVLTDPVPVVPVAAVASSTPLSQP